MNRRDFIKTAAAAPAAVVTGGSHGWERRSGGEERDDLPGAGADRREGLPHRHRGQPHRAGEGREGGDPDHSHGS
ncbi:MAG TPA: twin-arginine translocation signal domain-containing protein [Verrucomicrobiae bacterium]|nr:twin-arginine translocation signal domain-containing protein [Verrucomicrobiae bacterium]